MAVVVEDDDDDDDDGEDDEGDADVDGTVSVSLQRYKWESYTHRQACKNKRRIPYIIYGRGRIIKNIKSGV